MSMVVDRRSLTLRLRGPGPHPPRWAMSNRAAVNGDSSPAQLAVRGVSFASEVGSREQGICQLDDRRPAVGGSGTGERKADDDWRNEPRYHCSWCDAPRRLVNGRCNVCGQPVSTK